MIKTKDGWSGGASTHALVDCNPPGLGLTCLRWLPPITRAAGGPANLSGNGRVLHRFTTRVRPCARQLQRHQLRSDGKIYYVLSSQTIDTGAQIYSFDPARKDRHLGDLTEVCGEKGLKAIPQNKSHVRFWEANGKLYFASHIGYYAIKNGMEAMGVPPAGYKPYPGGHFLAYDMATGKFETWPSLPRRGDHCHDHGSRARTTLRFDLAYGLLDPLRSAHEGIKDLGCIRPWRKRSGTAIPHPLPLPGGRSTRWVVYFTTADGFILRYRYDRMRWKRSWERTCTRITSACMTRRLREAWGTTGGKVAWYPSENMVYGVHGNSGYLFRFDPRIPRVEVLDRITSLPSQRSGCMMSSVMGTWIYPRPDGKTLYYLTGGPIYRGGKRVAREERGAEG